MLRFVIILFLFFEIPIISNAAVVHNDDFIHLNKKSDEIHIVNDGVNRSMSEYDSALRLILTRNKVIDKLQEKPVNNPQKPLIDLRQDSFMPSVLDNAIDIGALLEAEAAWMEIKNNLDYINILLNKINIWAEDFLAKNIDENLILISDNDEVKRAYKIQNLINLNANRYNTINYIDKNRQNKSTNNGSNSNDSSHDSGYHNKGAFSLLYFWEKYSDIIIPLLVILGLWIGAQSLISIMARQNR